MIRAVAVAVFAPSVARIVTEPPAGGDGGAVKRPVFLSIVPILAFPAEMSDQVTLPSGTPFKLAVNVKLSPAGTVVAAGVTKRPWPTVTVAMEVLDVIRVASVELDGFCGAVAVMLI